MSKAARGTNSTSRFGPKHCMYLRLFNPQHWLDRARPRSINDTDSSPFCSSTDHGFSQRCQNFLQAIGDGNCGLVSGTSTSHLRPFCLNTEFCSPTAAAAEIHVAPSHGTIVHLEATQRPQLPCTWLPSPAARAPAARKGSTWPSALPAAHSASSAPSAGAPTPACATCEALQTDGSCSVHGHPTWHKLLQSPH